MWLGCWLDKEQTCVQFWVLPWGGVSSCPLLQLLLGIWKESPTGVPRATVMSPANPFNLSASVLPIWVRCNSATIQSYDGAEWLATITIGSQSWGHSSIPYGHGIEILALGSCLTIMIVAAQWHMISICNFHCSLPISKVNWEASKRWQVAFMWHHS